ncbi:MAG: tRNA (adenosine(37)-N6)-threonylcarbamoyltransferase complex transferase subunit TsaD [Cyanobacteria bacterium P01_H01_bin.119]
MATVLAIETSCDETAAAVVRDRRVLSNVVASQIATHAQYGGVVPELASRQHVQNLGWVIETAMADAAADWGAIDGIAVSCAPGLVGALLTGVSAAKTLAMVHHKPLLGVHHLEGHLYAAYLSEPALSPPYLCLLVSGGHTSLIHVKDCGAYRVLGKTRDDAAGEAFDKVARLLGLGYPGGPIIDRLAQTGDAEAFPLPEGNISLPEGGFHPYDASFSGLKTAVLRLIQKLQAEGVEPLPVADIAASFQATVARGLTRRAIACARDYQLETIAVGGGVAANSGLRQRLGDAAAAANLRVLFPEMAYCTDNAAMIGCAAADHFNRGHRSPPDLGAHSRLEIAAVMDLYAPSMLQ